jgi:putative Ca2+/H+ antiporter (TMEM165/GDT1 family)
VDGLMDGLWVSAALIFVAELGDRSQLMALTLAARHRASTVLAGITLATARGAPAECRGGGIDR